MQVRPPPPMPVRPPVPGRHSPGGRRPVHVPVPVPRQPAGPADPELGPVARQSPGPPATAGGPVVYSRPATPLHGPAANERSPARVLYPATRWQRLAGRCNPGLDITCYTLAPGTAMPKNPADAPDTRGVRAVKPFPSRSRQSRWLTAGASPRAEGLSPCAPSVCAADRHPGPQPCEGEGGLRGRDGKP